MSDPSDLDATEAYHPPPPTASAGERFAPGARLAGHDRIIAALGRGGMGEVYRADDLTLEQSVALKCLPAELERDPERLARFHAEVRTARQVSQVVSRNYVNTGRGTGIALLQSPKNSPSTCPVNRWLRS